jgi:hypothetical protein
MGSVTQKCVTQEGITHKCVTLEGMSQNVRDTKCVAQKCLTQEGMSQERDTEVRDIEVRDSEVHNTGDSAAFTLRSERAIMNSREIRRGTLGFNIHVPNHLLLYSGHQCGGFVCRVADDVKCTDTFSVPLDSQRPKEVQCRHPQGQRVRGICHIAPHCVT